MSKTTVLAMAGCGIVGSAVALKLLNQRVYYREKTGCDMELRYIFSRSFGKARTAGIDDSLFQADPEIVLADPEVSIVIELMGGVDFAREFVAKALTAGKHVVTANKAMLALHGAELLALARSKDVTLSFEASCAGGIPIIRALQDGLVANQIDALYGIVNGTCNYILTSMSQKGQDYHTALAAAQEIGFAEADPTFDVAGIDSAHKLSILASLAFDCQAEFAAIPVTGIDTLDAMDVVFGKELGYVVKLLAVANRLPGGLSLRVRPTFIATGHPLAWVSGPFNAVSVYGDTVGHTMYYGRGAGGKPTASAVIADIVSVASGVTPTRFSQNRARPDLTHPVVQLPLGSIRGRFYIRCMVIDIPGVFAELASALGRNGVSISSVLQKELPDADGSLDPVPIVITTHTVNEGDLERAISEIDALACTVQPSVCIEILDEFQESIA